MRELWLPVSLQDQDSKQKILLMLTLYFFLCTKYRFPFFPTNEWFPLQSIKIKKPKWRRTHESTEALLLLRGTRFIDHSGQQFSINFLRQTLTPAHTMKKNSWKKGKPRTYTRLFLVVLFIRAKTQKQLQCSSRETGGNCGPITSQNILRGVNSMRNSGTQHRDT